MLHQITLSLTAIMPAATQTVPSWMTGSTIKDIPLNGVSNGVKSKSSLSKHVHNTHSAALDGEGTPDDSTAMAPTNQTFRKDATETKTEDRTKYEGHKGDFHTKWVETGTAIEIVFEDLFRERLGVSISEFNVLYIKIGAE